ncbi:hypothetical protein HI914_04146 [Erysiphe necator]|nr:hypothetical protein HI914_04146 [Erysiphe necator]
MEFTGSGINWLDKKVLSNSNTIVHDSNYEDYPCARLKAPDYDNEKRTDEDVTDLARKIYNPIGTWNIPEQTVTWTIPYDVSSDCDPVGISRRSAGTKPLLDIFMTPVFG